MHSPKISVIVPVYNVEKCLRRCVDSILAQTFTDFELLLVDDGSTDNSGVICDEYATKVSRVRVFHKPNGGVSSARNFGLDNAQGEWIAFVDSDDWVTKDCLEIMIEGENTDFTMANYTLIGDNNWKPLILDEVNYDGENITDFLENQLPYCSSPWAKLIRRKILVENNIKFNDHFSYGEDTIFIMDVLSHVNSIRVVNKSIYIYDVSHIGTLSKCFDRSMCITLINAIGSRMIKLSNKYKWDCKKIKNRIIRIQSNIALFGIDYNSKDAINQLKDLCDNPNIKDVILDNTLLKSLPKRIIDKLLSYKLYGIVVLLMRLRHLFIK